MAMSKRPTSSQEQFWIPTDSIVTSPGHPFCERLNALLQAHDLDAFVEDLCRLRSALESLISTAC